MTSSRANQGFALQIRTTTAILQRFRDWDSVTVTDGRGRVITSASDVPLTRDGGIDLILRIRADLPPRNQKALQTRIRKVFESERFE